MLYYFEKNRYVYLVLFSIPPHYGNKKRKKWRVGVFFRIPLVGDILSQTRIKKPSLGRQFCWHDACRHCTGKYVVNTVPTTARILCSYESDVLLLFPGLLVL